MQHCTPTHGSIPQILTLGLVHLKYNQHCEENMFASERWEITGKHVKQGTSSWLTNAVSLIKNLLFYKLRNIRNFVHT